MTTTERLPIGTKVRVVRSDSWAAGATGTVIAYWQDVPYTTVELDNEGGRYAAEPGDLEPLPDDSNGGS